jgi:pre-mRNA-processing factor 39
LNLKVVCNITILTSVLINLQIALQFLDTFGDAQSIKKATTRHTVLFSRRRSILPSKKRRADDAAMSDREKMAKTGDGAQPFTGTDPNAHNPSVWPATSESSAQQWGAAYPPQVAYYFTFYYILCITL